MWKEKVKSLLKRGIGVLVGLTFFVIGFCFHFWKQTLVWYDGAGRIIREIEYFPYRYRWDLFYWFISIILLIIGYSEFKSENKVMLERGYPLGVWGLTMMNIVGGILFLVGAIGPVLTYFLQGLFGVAYLVLGRVWYPNVYVGIFCFTVAYGLWKAKLWGWALCMISSFMSIILAVPGITSTPPSWYAVDPRPYHASGFITNLLCIYYLMRSHVRKFFGCARG
ncbi:hypothetical protein J7L06_06005 [Candidatus Bathyarchaeota archaeon]|nr:hypothetical protein [Candidatus Bathyarchaeota archaeon]